MLYLWRRLNAGSGGPGFNRGGLGLDFAWAPHNTQALMGTLENAMAAVPSRGMLGGLPGAGNEFRAVRGTNAAERIGGGGPLAASVEELGGAEEVLLNHVAGVPLPATDVFHQITGGGAGIGDPLLRDPARVEADVRDGFVSAEQAASGYGVIVGDAAATEERRRAVRAGRLGHEPEREPEPMTEWRAALVLRDDELACGHCGRALASTAVNWKDHAAHWSGDAAEILGSIGVKVKRRAERPMVLHAWSCPACGTFLETNLYPDDMEPLHDLHVGARAAVPEGARPV
jgi:N-methylhydantoinase B